jgi:hypothetical protein
MQFYCVAYEMAIEGTISRFAQIEDQNENEDILNSLMLGMGIGFAPGMSD